MIRNYLKIALRNLWRHRAFSFINVLGLAVGLTACFLIFLYVRFETSYDDFQPKKDRIYRITTETRTPSESIWQSYTLAPLAKYLKTDFPEVEDAIRFCTDGSGLLIRRGDLKIQEKGIVITDSTLFNVFNFPLLKGDPHTALREPMSLVLSETAARKYFGKEDPMGQQLLMTGAAKPATVTGIMKDIPANSQIKADIFIPISSCKTLYGVGLNEEEWTNHIGFTYLLLKPGTNPHALAAKFPAFMERHHGKQAAELQMMDYLSLEPMKDVYLRSKYEGFESGNINNVYIVSIIALFILLIAGINFINLTTARSTERAKEVGIRKVVGAARKQLLTQFMGESIIISLLAYILSLLLCSVLMPLFNQLAGKTIAESIFDNATNPLLLLGMALLIGFLAGFYPSLVLSGFRPISVLKGRFTTGVKGLFLRKALVVFQFTVSIGLIISTIIVYKQLEYMRNKDLGFQKDQTIAIPTNYDKNKELFKQSLTAIPGVLSSSFSSDVPSQGYNSAYTLLQNSKGEMAKTNIDLYFVDFDFTKLYGLQLAAGRGLSSSNPTDSTQAMLINETAARFLGYAHPQDAIGRDYEQWGSKGKIVGVLKDFNYKSLQQPITPLSMRYNKEAWGTISVKLSNTQLPQTLKAIEKSWSTVIPNRPFEYQFLDESFSQHYKAEDRFGNLFFNFAILAIFISCLGLLGLASYSTLQRTREIGVRKVLGASVSNIIHLLSADFIRLVLIAFVIATPLGWLAMNKWLGDFAYRTPIHWWIFGLAGIAALFIAFAAISFQAIKAALVSPVKSLKAE